MKLHEFRKRCKAEREKQKRVDAAIQGWVTVRRNEKNGHYEAELDRLKAMLHADSIAKLTETLREVSIFDPVHDAMLAAIGIIERDESLDLGEKLMQTIFTILRSKWHSGEKCPLCQRE